ncbi:hypothetical protein CBFG_01420 [Clostridiales bacterium 1_7_47FAA]|nr:hypothetical protein CBFG_01420 [Clostridiales bacterium 1_7_47FAA]
MKNNMVDMKGLLQEWFWMQQPFGCGFISAMFYTSAVLQRCGFIAVRQLPRTAHQWIKGG